MSLYLTDPLLDKRWDDLVATHPRASVFHQRGWLKALSSTYGYEPLVLTSAPAGEPLRDGIVLCRVSSWITGARLVSIPFADHCEPLLNDLGQSIEFMNWLRTECDRQPWRYVELRPLLPPSTYNNGWHPGSSYWFHELDITPSLDRIFRGMHRNCIQRRISRAERARISYEVGQSEQLADEFYRLLLTTRKRHHVLPQPRAWFKNLLEHLGDKVQIRLARQNGTPIAAILTLHQGSSVVYKYGCSDGNFHNLGGMPFLFWRLIEESKALGAEKIDFGRSDLDNEGLIRFKDRFGTAKKLLTYYRCPHFASEETEIKKDLRSIVRFFSTLPDMVSCTAGTIIYKHLG